MGSPYSQPETEQPETGRVPPKMESQDAPSGVEQPDSSSNPNNNTCWKKSGEGSFFDNLKEIAQISMAKHYHCVKNSFKEMTQKFGSQKVDAENGSGIQELESSPPLQTTVSQ